VIFLTFVVGASGLRCLPRGTRAFAPGAMQTRESIAETAVRRSSQSGRGMVRSRTSFRPDARL